MQARDIKDILEQYDNARNTNPGYLLTSNVVEIEKLRQFCQSAEFGPWNDEKQIVPFSFMHPAKNTTEFG